MRAVVQRVHRAAVSINDGQEVVGSIGKGLCVLVGVNADDKFETDAEYIIRKLLSLRLFEDPQTGKSWVKSVSDLNLDILCVSQFTLFANTRRGTKPDFHGAMAADQSRLYYERFLQRLREEYKQGGIVEDGRFGAMMSVDIVNDGPVTIILDSKN